MQRPHRFIERPSGQGALHACLTLILVLSGACISVGPDYESPDLETPASFLETQAQGLESQSAALDAWWKKLEDPVLDSLIQRALSRNLSLRESLARITETRALRGIIATGLRPTIDVQGSYTREQFSEQTASGAFGARAADRFGVGFDSFWELDLWGRVSRSVEAAQAEIEVSVEDTRDVLVSVLSETALNYIELRSFQERSAIARANIAIQEQTLTLSRSRFDAGLVSELDVVQAESVLEGTRSALPPFEAGARAARNRLAVLLGLAPGALEAELAPAGTIPAPPASVAVGIPAELLRRRPDIRRSERLLAAQSARIGVASADLYPRFTLFGSIGLSAEEPGKLSERSAAGFSFGPSLTWNVFDRSRVRSAIVVEEARQEQLLLAYERSVLRALEEVENATTGFLRDQRRRDSLARGVEHAQRAVELSRTQYRQGLVSFQSVLDSQQRLFDLEDLLAVTRASISANLVVLYKALGGGWENNDIILGEGQGVGEPTR